VIKCTDEKCTACNIPHYEYNARKCVHQYLDRLIKAGKVTGVFIDGGAHVGLWSLNIAQHYTKRRTVHNIFAFEPNGSTFKILQQNAAAQGGITPIQFALWNRTQDLFLKSTAMSAGNYVSVDDREGETVTKVKAIALDDMITGNKTRIDGIKLDIEGAELLALNGLRQLLGANDNLILVVEFSIGWQRRFGYTTEQLLSFIQRSGFRFARKEDRMRYAKMREPQVKTLCFVKGDIC